MKIGRVLVAVITVVFVLVCAKRAETADEPFPGCNAALGLSNGSITDRQITASSTSNLRRHAPHLARLNTLPTTSGWCSSTAKEKQAYLEVDLGRSMRVSAISTTGVMVRNDTTGKLTYTFVSEYFLAYKRDGCKKWRHYREDEMSVTVFKAKNSSHLQNVPQKHYLLTPRIARYLRFVANEGVGNRWCLKVEVYGCPWENQDGLVSYKTSQGNYRESVDKQGRPSPYLRDISYDGHRLAYGTKVGVLSSGLGQLVDGVLGLPADWNNTRDPKWINWIGWHDTVTNRPSVTFKFSSLREFTGLRVHVLNYPGIVEKMMFSKLVISFSKDGEYYSWKVIYEPSITRRRQMKDTAFWIHVDLKHSVGMDVKCEFYYQGWWAMVSEVQFESSLVRGPDDGLSTASAGASSLQPSVDPEFRETPDVTVNESTKEKEEKNRVLIISTVVGGLFVTTLFILLAVWLCKRKTRRTAEATDNNALVSLRILNPGKKNSLNRRNDPTAHGRRISKKLKKMRKEDLEDEEMFDKMNNMTRTELGEELLKANHWDSPKNLRPESRELSIKEEKAEVLAEMRRAYASLT